MALGALGSLVAHLALGAIGALVALVALGVLGALQNQYQPERRGAKADCALSTILS